MIREWVDNFLGYKDLYLAEREWTQALNEKLMEVEKENAVLKKEMEKVLEESLLGPYGEK